MENNIKEKKKPNRRRSATLCLQLTPEEKNSIIALGEREHLKKTDIVMRAIEYYTEYLDQKQQKE